MFVEKPVTIDVVSNNVAGLGTIYDVTLEDESIPIG
jgi:hypothetical protein